MLFSMRTKTGTLAECMVRGMGSPMEGRRSDAIASRSARVRGVVLGAPRLGDQLAEPPPLRARRIEVRGSEPGLERALQRGPLPVDDRVPGVVAVASLHHHRLAERALVAEAEPLGGAARGRVEAVALPLV